MSRPWAYIKSAPGVMALLIVQQMKHRVLYGSQCVAVNGHAVKVCLIMTDRHHFLQLTFIT